MKGHLSKELFEIQIHLRFRLGVLKLFLQQLLHELMHLHSSHVQDFEAQDLFVELQLYEQHFDSRALEHRLEQHLL
jgi:hypothetical protein